MNKTLQNFTLQEFLDNKDTDTVQEPLLANSPLCPGHRKDNSPQ